MERWLRREESDDNRKALRKEFHNDKIKAHIHATAPVIGEQFNRLYSQLIDFGAHPNEKGYSLNTKIKRTGHGDAHIQTVYLQAEGIQLDMRLRVASQNRPWALQVLQPVNSER